MLQGRGKRMAQYSYQIQKSLFYFPDIRYFVTRNSLIFILLFGFCLNLQVPITVAKAYKTE